MMNVFRTFLAIVLLSVTSPKVTFSADALEPEPDDTTAMDVETSKDALQPSTYGPTKRGDVLWNIASRVVPDASISTEQMIWALYSHNPDAFENNDLHRLKPGVVLKIPPLGEAKKISRATAQRNIKKSSPPAISPPAPSAPSPTPSQPDSPAARLEKELQQTQRETVEAQREQKQLKKRLKDMEKQIQELMLKNAERDARLQERQKSAN